MKRSMLILLAFLLSVGPEAWADPALKSLSERVAGSLVSFSYRFTTLTEVPVKGDGVALVQGDAFFLKGNGLEVWCDGQVRWTLDQEAKEAVVERVAEGQRDYAADPALLISSVEEAFRETAAGQASFQGKAAHRVALVPLEKGTGLQGVELFFRSDRLCGLVVTASDGTRTEFTLTDLRFADPGDTARFRFDESTLDKTWLVTDLR